MARNTFGGDIHDLIARPDAQAQGALKAAPGITIAFYRTATGGSVESDFMLEGATVGVFDAPTSSIVTRNTGYLPDFQGPDGVSILFYDPDPADADVQRVRLVSREAGVTASVPAASTTTAGISRFGTSTELDAGTAANVAANVAGVARMIGNHVNADVPHPEYATAISQLQGSLASKASLVNNTLPLENLPASVSASPNTLVLRRENGSIAVGAASLPDEPPPLSQVQGIVASGGSVTSDVRYTELASQPTSTSATFPGTVIPDIVITDAATGQKWQCDYSIQYQATTAAGIQVRHKTGAAAVTNRLSNPSFDTDTANWTAGNASTSIARSTAAGGQVGTAALAVTTTALTPTSQIAFSEFVPCEPGSVWTAGGYGKFGSGSARSARVDLVFSDATGSRTIAGGAFLGSVVPFTATWQRSTLENVTAPTWATQVCVRASVVSGTTTVNDVNYFDALQLEPGATLPAYGSTGGSGATALTFAGQWGPGLTTGATTQDNYTRTTAIRYPANTNLTAAHGGLGVTTDAVLTGSLVCTVGGVNLSNQRIELEFAQRVADAANATRVVAATAVFARLA